MKVVLSPSTQPSNGCAFGDSEQDHCGQLAQKMVPLLTARGVSVRLRGRQSITSSANDANAWQADLYLPMHTNAVNGKVRGVRFGYYPGRTDSKAKCNIFAKHMKQIYPIPGNVKVGTYEFLEARVPRMPSVYCELVFHDNLEDAQWFHANMDLIAQTLVDAIAECGESEMIPAPIPAPVPAPVPVPTPTHEEAVKVSYQATVKTVGDPTLNIWADTSKSRSLKLVAKNAVVEVIEEVSTKWAKITYAGITGYADRQYLEAVVGSVTPAPSTEYVTLTLDKKVAETLLKALNAVV